MSDETVRMRVRCPLCSWTSTTWEEPAFGDRIDAGEKWRTHFIRAHAPHAIIERVYDLTAEIEDDKRTEARREAHDAWLDEREGL